MNLIAHTKAVTTWGEVAVGDPVNLEIDTLARYVARLAEATRRRACGSGPAAPGPTRRGRCPRTPEVFRPG